MGFAGYYQRFITGYSRIAAPMTRLQSPKVPFVFDDDARRSFQALKTTMLMAPVLSIYDPTLPTRVTTDASGYGIGAVLEQHDDDEWHPVEYFSHKVPLINSLDDARKKELLAFVMALKCWRHFLLGRRRFTWVTDNNPLTYYKTQDMVSSTIGRWMYFIDQFDFTPKHVPGLSNRTTDALSRRPDLCAMSHHAFAFDEELHATSAAPRHSARSAVPRRSARSQCHVSSAMSQCQISSATSAVPRQQCQVTVPRQTQCHVSSDVRQCHVSSATSAVPCQTQCHVSSATSAVPRQTQCHVSSATSAVPCHTVPRQTKCHVSNMTGLPGQLANEPIADYKKRVHAQLAAIEAEEQRQLTVKAAQLQADEAATAEKLRLQAEADADAQARRKEAQALLQRHEANIIEKLKLVYTCNHLQSELANLQRAVRNQKTKHEDATRALDARVLDLEQAVPGPAAGASSSASSSRQLEERVDHVVAMLGDISVFTEPSTISQRFELLDSKISQQQQTDHSRNNSSARPYKMPTFRIEKFDDYTHQDPVVWWQGFTTELGIHEVPDHLFISALFINTKGGCQIWLSHMATIHDIQVSDLYKKLSWEDMTKEWKKRFIVDDAPTLAVNRIFTMAQGSTPTRDWLTNWQKIVATPDLDLSFPHLRREFYNRSCAALSLALGDREQYSTFAEIINKARELIKTNRPTAHEKSTWQPTYVEKVRTGPRQQQFVAVQSDGGETQQPLQHQVTKIRWMLSCLEATTSPATMGRRNPHRRPEMDSQGNFHGSSLA
ncbi:hypothetical protein CBR_g44906 [Chara braunii]|uniref:Reverse transcriptase/retrotransposon-derived protein RNase H-like domain-containing protein n=1 Tax=Chara braunii TaxID=69332 RepID=A0A388LY60_CHABU|nr:hypothetical protein CBR_g44906 [Chara braunii]|eukprot:GBG87172.1 hypothetical protein CBR_g44906 [Chara braunii]